MIVILSDLEVKLDDILNAYVQAPVTKKMWTTLGPEVGIDARKTAVAVREFYGLKSAWAAFRSYLARCMESLGYESCRSDPNSWLKQVIRQEDRVQYCVLWMIFFVYTTMKMLF